MSQRCSKYFLTIYSLAFFSCAFFTSWQTINYKSCHLQATTLRSGHNTTSEDVLTERHIRYNKRELKKKNKNKKTSQQAQVLQCPLLTLSHSSVFSQTIADSLYLYNNFSEAFFKKSFPSKMCISRSIPRLMPQMDWVTWYSLASEEWTRVSLLPSNLCPIK